MKPFIRRNWLKNAALLGIIPVAVFITLAFFPNPILGIFLLALFLLLGAQEVSQNLQRAWRFSGGLTGFIIGIFLTMSVLGSVAGVFIVFGRLTSVTIAIIFWLTGLLLAVVSRWLSVNDGAPAEFSSAEQIPRKKLGWCGVVLVIGYGVLFVGSVATLVISSRIWTVITPWHSIEPWYIGLFFAATLILGILLYYKVSGTLALGLLMVHGLLWHSFLPLTHPLIYGADGWRHIGNEAVIVMEQPVKKALLNGEELSLIQKIDPGTFSYSQLWAIMAILNRLSGVSLLALYAWFLPIISAFVFPLLFNEFGKRFGLAERTRLVAGWLAFLPFALSSAGAFTLPVNYGLLVWLVGMIFLTERCRQPAQWQIPVLVGWGVLALFGYTLYFVLFWLAWGLLELLAHLRVKQYFKSQQIVGVSILFGLVIPVFELVARYSYFQPIRESIAGVKQLIGNFLALYLANGPRPHDIATGNIIFNQVPSYAFVVNSLTFSRWWLVAVALAFFVLAAIGWRYLLKKSGLLEAWFAALSLVLIISYGVGRYWLMGEQVLSRRLDAVLATCFVLLAIVGWSYVSKVWAGSRVARMLPGLFLIVISAAIAASYSLGPDTRTVSLHEYNAMEYVWAEEKSSANHCVIAATYPLLALEALSAREIIGGGFPINQYFAQPELTGAYNQLSAHSELGWPDKVWQATGATRCFVVLSNPSENTKRWFAKRGINFKMFGGEKPLYPAVAVWEYAK